MWLKTITDDGSDHWVNSDQLVVVTQTSCEDESDLTGVDTHGRLHALAAGTPSAVDNVRRNITET